MAKTKWHCKMTKIAFIKEYKHVQYIMARAFLKVERIAERRMSPTQACIGHKTSPRKELKSRFHLMFSLRLVKNLNCIPSHTNQNSFIYFAFQIFKFSVMQRVEKSFAWCVFSEAHSEIIHPYQAEKAESFDEKITQPD